MSKIENIIKGLQFFQKKGDAAWRSVYFEKGKKVRGNFFFALSKLAEYQTEEAHISDICEPMATKPYGKGSWSIKGGKYLGEDKSLLSRHITGS